jgi:Flp pilus assembly protein TadD
MKKMTILARIAFLTLAGIGLSACATNPDSGFADAIADDLALIEDPVREGDDAARRGEFEDALKNYLLAISTLEEPDPEVWFRVGAVCTHIGRTQQALRAYLEVLKIKPDHSGALEGAGLEYMELNMSAEAREHLLAAASADPTLWRAQNALGILADREQDHELAIEHYEKALEINTASPMILNNLGYSRYLSGDLDQAARDFYQATQIDPDYLPAWSNLGLVYARRGWYWDAVEILGRSLEQAVAYNNTGFVAMENGDLREAELLLTEAIRLSPTYYEKAYRNLETVRLRLRGEEGRGGFESRLGLAPMSASTVGTD